MSMGLIIAVAALSLAALSLLVRSLLVDRSLGEITQQLDEILGNDTNSEICVSSGSRRVRRLASELNSELRKLRTERRRLQSGDAEFKEAITNISHDIRTPLTAIFGYIGLLEREEKSEAAQRYTAVIKERSQALCELSEELFKYSVAISAQNDLHPEPLDINAVLQESVIAYYAALTGKNIEPELDLPDHPVIRNADKTALMRIFGNVIGNAVKYSQGDLKVQLLDSGTVTFSNKAPGLDAVQAGKLFNRFYTVRSADNSTGLGLSIAKRLTEQMGGSIDAAAEDGVLTVKVSFTE